MRRPPSDPLPVFDLDELAEYVIPHIIDLCQADLAAGRHQAENRIGIAAMYEAIRILDRSRQQKPLSQVIKEFVSLDDEPIEAKFAAEFPKISALFDEAATISFLTGRERENAATEGGETGEAERKNGHTGGDDLHKEKDRRTS